MTRHLVYRVVKTDEERVGVHDAARPYVVLAEEHGSSYRSVHGRYVENRYPTRTQAMRRKRTLESR